ncbi:MAG: OmpA family protein [Ignavibacteriaceae bacterium]
MKKSSFVLLLSLSLLLVGNSFAQTMPSRYDWLPQSSWAFGFGGIFDRYVSTNTEIKGPGNFGGYLSIQKNYTEHVGLRLGASYLHLEGKAGAPLTTITNNSFVGNFDLLYYLAPVEPVSPYLGVGFGGVYYTLKNSPIAELNKSFFDYQVNLTFGSEWTIAADWKLKTEFGYHTVPSSKFDGVYGTNSGGILGGNTDSYMTFEVGFLYYFHKGPQSHLSDMYDGVGTVDYGKIEDIVKKYQTQPTEVDYNRIEDIVKKNTPTVVGGAAAPSNWVLIGVNFDFNKATLKPESLPILYNAAETLLQNPDVKVEIQGYTDNIGSEKYNKKLSLERAETVKQFLVAKKVAASRLTTIGLGAENPIVSNKTAQGRGLNRRIEFKVIK